MTKQFKLTVKGQVTIPKDVRDLLGLKPGEPVAFERDGNRVVVRKGDTETPDAEARMANMRRRIERARRFALPMDMSTDEYMAMIREPVPVPNRDP